MNQFKSVKKSSFPINSINERSRIINASSNSGSLNLNLFPSLYGRTMRIGKERPPANFSREKPTARAKPFNLTTETFKTQAKVGAAMRANHRIATQRIAEQSSAAQHNVTQRNVSKRNAMQRNAAHRIALHRKRKDCSIAWFRGTESQEKGKKEKRATPVLVSRPWWT